MAPPAAHFARYEDTTAVPELAASASGIILELGPGLGSQLGRFDPTKVEHIYGVESNNFFIPDLKAKVTQSGLDGKYTLLPFGVQETDMLAKHGITPGSIDTIVSFQVLCSVPQPDEVAKELYGLLKPGGNLIFWEHHGSHDWLTRIVQSKSCPSHI
jgi:SAM-dependent methyltransferase